jgi:putative DNA primase/helicase
MTMNVRNRSFEDEFAESEQLCRAIHGGEPFGVLTFKRNSGTKSSSYNAPTFSYGTYAEHARKFKMYQAQGIEPFLLAGRSDGNGHADTNITHTWVICVDFDDGYPEFLVKNQLVSPSFRIETSPERYHAGWILDTYALPEDARSMQKVMADRLGGDYVYAKLSQLIRMPGFENTKRGVIAQLNQPFNPTKTFSLDFLKQAFDFNLVLNRIQHAVPLFDSSLVVNRQQYDCDTVVADARDALQYLKDDANHYGTWLPILMALVPLGDKGKKLAEEFSKWSSKYDPHEFEKKWGQIQNSPGSVASIFLKAQRNGWKNPGFRHTTVGSAQIYTSRDFGRMIATELGDDYAVIVPDDSCKPTFLEWDGAVYKAISKTMRRQIVEQAGNKVIAALVEGKSIDASTAKALKHMLGTNRNLDDICDVIADVMLFSSERRLVRKHPYFGLANGVLNTISQELVPVRYRAIPLVRSPAIFDPTATAPIFERVVDEIFEGDMEMVRYIYQLAGYMLAGKRTHQLFIVFLGPSSSNGKNTLANILQYILGGYAMALPITTIMTKSLVADGATPVLAKLEGKQLAVLSEPNEKHSIDSGAVKSLTGDKFLSVRQIYSDSKDIELNFLLLMLANKLPIVRDNDHGLWRRMKIIPFCRRFVGKNDDGNLGEKLMREASGIVNIMLAGARDFQLNGMKEPDKVQAAIHQQKSAVDPIEAFIADTILLEAGFKVQLKMLYDQTYKNWAKLNPTFLPLTKPQFSERLEAKGYVKFEKARLIYFIGLRPNDLPVS